MVQFRFYTYRVLLQLHNSNHNCNIDCIRLFRKKYDFSIFLLLSKQEPGWRKT